MGRAIVALAMAMLAGCMAASSSSSVTASPAAAPLATPSAPPAASPSAPPAASPSASQQAATTAPGPIVHGPFTIVHGTESCADANVAPSPDPSGVLHARGGQLNCSMRFDDPRVSGQKTGPFEFDAWGSLEDGAMVQWGANRRIENAGGAWVGWFSGVYTSDGGDAIQAWYQGTGGYAGLVFEEMVVGKSSGVYQVTGLIFSGTIPSPWASMTAGG